MEFIEMDSENVYKIPNTFHNDYIKSFLNQFGIISNIDDNFITIKVSSIETLNKKSDDALIHKFIYDIGCQILLLKKNNLAIKYFNLEDIVIINSNIFLFINPNMIYELLEKKIVKENLPSHKYGVFSLESIDFNSKFIPIEIINSKKNPNSTKKYYYYTTSFYSLAKLLLYYFNIDDIEDIKFTSLYFFCKRCLVDNPLERNLLFI
jgi:hypothetical protein